MSLNQTLDTNSGTQCDTLLVVLTKESCAEMQALQHNKIAKNSHQVINEYLDAMKIEINLSINYKSIFSSTFRALQSEPSLLNK